MIVEMTYDNGKHIATYSLGSIHNIKKVKVQATLDRNCLP